MNELQQTDQFWRESVFLTTKRHDPGSAMKWYRKFQEHEPYWMPKSTLVFCVLLHTLAKSSAFHGLIIKWLDSYVSSASCLPGIGLYHKLIWVESWEKMVAKGFQCSPWVYSCLVTAYARADRYPDAIDCLSYMRNKPIPLNSVAINSMLRLFIRKGNTGGAIELYSSMRLLGDCETVRIMMNSSLQNPLYILLDTVLLPPVQIALSHNFRTAIDFACNKLGSECAFGLLYQMFMFRVGIPSLEGTYTNVICTCVKNGNVDLALMASKLMRRRGHSLKMSVLTSLMTEFIHQGDLSCALELFDKMRKFGLYPDLDAYTVIIEGCANHGNMAKAVELNNQMKLAGIPSSGEIVHSLIKGFFNAGMTDEGQKLLKEEMKDGVGNTFTYNDVVGWFRKEASASASRKRRGSPASASRKRRGSPLKAWKRKFASVGALYPIAETVRTHDWRLLVKYTVYVLSSSKGNTLEFEDDEEIDGGRHLKAISDKDLQLSSLLKDDESFLVLLKMYLPSLAETLEAHDWSLLQKFSSTGSMDNIEVALKSELAALCVIFLLTKVPLHVKEVAACTLSFISLGNSKVTKLSFDESGVEDLMVRILSSGNVELQRQVCIAFYILANCPLSCLTVTFFGTGVQDALLHLVCNLKCIPDLTYPVIKVVSGFVCDRSIMGEKIFKAELLDHLWFVELLHNKDDESIMECACWLLARIARGRCDHKLWVHLKEDFLPEIFDGFFLTTVNVHVRRSAVCFILEFSTYGTPDQINQLVKMGGLKYLVIVCAEEDDVHFLEKCLDAVEAILRAGDAKAKADIMDKVKVKEDEDFELVDMEELGVEVENEYAKMIHPAWWEVFLLNLTPMVDNHPLVWKARRIVQKYEPELDHKPASEYRPFIY